MQKGKLTILLMVSSFLALGCLPGPTNAASLNINTATEAELTSLPYIGPIRARTIIDCRKDHGPFNDSTELLACTGIGPDTLAIMRADLMIPGSPEPPPRPPRQNRNEADAARTNNTEGALLILADAEYFPVLLAKIQESQESIELTMFVFKTTKSPENRPGRIAEELIAATRRGVRVQVFLEKSGYDENLNKTNQRTAERLGEHGIKVTFDSPNITTHAKLVVIDQRYSFVGSHNFTHSALKSNHELSLLVDDHDLARKLTTYMQAIVNP